MHAIDSFQRTSDTDDLASQQFRTFAGVLLTRRHAAIALADAEARAGATTLSNDLCQLIELQRMEADRRGGGLDTQLPGRYLKAALADEMMLQLDWAGRVHWRHVMVEATLFHSARAGEQVFAEIDQLLRERDPERRVLARLYLQLLALGFQGRYRGADSLAQIAHYRRELFQFAWQRVPDLQNRPAVLSQQPYDCTITDGGQTRIARSSRPLLMFAALMALLLAVSEGLWVWQSWEVRALLNRSAHTQEQGAP